MTIQRYDLEDASRNYQSWNEMVAQTGDWGDWVKFEDHKKIVDDLQKEISDLQSKLNFWELR